MTLAVWFWLFYVLSIFLCVWREHATGYLWYKGLWIVAIYVLLGLIGFKIFGSPIQS